MAESITFQFLTRGAEETAGGFKRVGDTAALAARGAKVLSDVIKDLGQKEDRTAAESVTLAKALRLTGDAEDRAAAKAVLADAAIRRVGDAMQDVSKKPLIPQVQTAKALKALAGIQLRADELKAKFPDFTVKIDDAAAKAKLALFAAEAKVTLDKIDKGIAGAGSGGILGKIGGLFGGGGASSGASGAANAGGGAAPLLTNPYVLAGGTAAALAALPFLAQTAAGAITVGLGGALAGIAILGASKTKSVQDSFARLKTSASADLGKIGASFVPVLNSILGTATSVLGKLTPVFAGAAKTISAPFQAFGDALLKAFNQPAVKQSIADVAVSFGAILKAVTPSLAAGIGQIATGVSKLAAAVAANPNAFRDFIGFLFAATGGVLTALAALTRFATYIEQHFLPAIGDMGLIALKGTKIVTDAFLSMVGSVLHGASDAFGWIPGLGGKLRDASKSFDSFKAGVDKNFSGMINATQAWRNSVDTSRLAADTATKAILADFQGQSAAAKRGRDDMTTFTNAVVFSGAKTEATRSARAVLIRDLENSGVTAAKARQLVDNLQASVNRLHGKTVSVLLHAAGSGSIYFNESTGVGGSVKGGLKFMARGGKGPALAVVGEQGPELVSLPPGARVYPHGKSAGMLKAMGIPGFAAGGMIPNPGGLPGWMGGIEAPFGKAVENSWAVRLIANLKAAVKKAAAAVGSVAYHPAAGVTQWEGTALRALAMLGLPAGDLVTVMSQIQTESGGNPNIVNKWDSNWLAGHPSVGLMQVIQGTFDAYAGPFRNTGPFSYGVSVNPLANIYAGLNYARHAYGNPGWLSVLGHGHGYDSGGWLPTGTSIAVNNTGKPEMVLPAGSGGVAGGRAVQVQLDITGGDQELVALLRKIVRVRGGGNVQAAFGR